VKVDGSDKIRIRISSSSSWNSFRRERLNQYEAYADTLSGSVSSVNGQTGVVVLDSDDVSEGSTRSHFTSARAKAAAVADAIQRWSHLMLLLLRTQFLMRWL
jgi:hypothetical protein